MPTGAPLFAVAFCYADTMNLRLATENDLSVITMLLRRVVPLMLSAGNRQWDETYPNESIFRHDVAKFQLWIAEIDNTIAGFAAITEGSEPEYAHAGLNIDEPAITVHRLAVDPAFRGAGLAIALMHKAEQIASERGIVVVRVDTSTENEATQRLFPKLGYRRAGEISLQMRPNLRVLCYEKRLPAK